MTPDIMLKKLDWYIIKKFMTTFLFAIMVLVVISCVIDYSEKADNIVSKHVPGAVILNYYKNFIPHITALLFPLFIFIATIFFTSKLAYKTEIVAMLSSGMSFQRFLRPYFVGGSFLCLFSLFANHWLIPMADKQRVAFEDKYINEGNYIYPGENVHLSLSKELYIYIQSFNFTNNVGTHFTAEKMKDNHLLEKVMADQITYDSVKKIWHLTGVVIRQNDSLKENLTLRPEMDMKYDFVPRDINNNEALKEALTTPELLKFIATETLRGRSDLSSFEVEFHRRSAQPFAALILTIIGACIASRKIRGGSGFHLALGVAISAIYIMIMQFSTVLATKASFNPFVAVWIPNLLFVGVAYIIYRRQLR